MLNKKTFFSCLLSLLLLTAVSAPALADEYYLADGSRGLEEIAAATGVESELLAAINDIDAAEKPQGLLLLPEQPQLVITVQAGDTVYSLATSRGLDIELLAAANGLNRDYLIYPGQELVYPLPEEQAVLSSSHGNDNVEEALAVSTEAAPAQLQLASRAAAAGSSWLWPISGVITSQYGERERGFHYGLDIAADQGTVIGAAAAGLVSEADWKNDAYGYAVMIDHGNGYVTLYGHCSELLVESGTQVTAGQAIALVGSTGNSTGPHVHFEIRSAGQCIDPLPYLPAQI